MSHPLYIKDGKIETSHESIVYWAAELKCSQENLQEAIARIGNGYTILVLYLEMNRLINDD